MDNNITKPIIMFLDGIRSHMPFSLSNFCDQNQIILYAFPPNATHIIQPADMSVFRPLKLKWKKTVQNWQSKPDNVNANITKNNFAEVFKEALDNVNMVDYIKNGF